MEEIEITQDDHVKNTKSVVGSDVERGSGRGRGIFKSKPSRSAVVNTSSQVSKKSSDSQPRRRRSYCLPVFFILLVCAGLGAVVLWRQGVIGDTTGSSLSSSAQGSSDRQTCNGLASNCNLKVNDVMFAAVHNAMSSRDKGFVPPNNLLKLEDALNAGFRALLIDTCSCQFFGAQLCHSFCATGFRKALPVFESIVTFMKNNPTEVVIIEFQVNNDSILDVWDEISQIDGFESLLYSFNGTSKDDWPLMRDLIATDKRLLMFQHNGPNCNEGLCPYGLHNTYTYMFETPYDADGVDALMNVTETCTVETGSKRRGAFFISNHFATNRALLPDSSVAEEANTAVNLINRLDACQEMLGRQVNLLVVDFWNLGDTLAVVKSYNEDRGRNFTSAPNSTPNASPVAVAPTPSPAGQTRNIFAT